jgi:hypothetical protein
MHPPQDLSRLCNLMEESIWRLDGKVGAGGGAEYAVLDTGKVGDIARWQRRALIVQAALHLQRARSVASDGQPEPHGRRKDMKNERVADRDSNEGPCVGSPSRSGKASLCHGARLSGLTRPR